MPSLTFNSVFREANETRKRYRVLLGSAGSGKSVNVAQDYILKLTSGQYPGANLMVVRATETSHLNSTFAELSKAIQSCGVSHLWDIRTNPMLMRCTVTGSSILFRGCNDARALERLKSVTCQSGKLTWIWVEEATELRASDFEILDDRLRGDIQPELFYQITLTFNPINAQHWIKLRLWDVLSNDTFKLKTTYLENRFIDDAYRKRMERRSVVDPEGYRVYGLGEWGDSGCNILREYKQWVCDKDLSWYDSVVMAQDFGFNHANALLLVGFKDGDLYVIQELYEFERHTGELIEMATAQGFPKNVVMYCDSAEPDRIKEWSLAGWRAIPVQKGPGSVKAQIDYLKQKVIHIDESCIHTFKEAQQWRWKKDGNDNVLDEPLEVEDDAMAALRYAIEPFRKVKKMRTISKDLLGIR